MRFLVAPCSFKGTLSASRACEVISSAILSVDPDSNVDLLPVADGGEGTLECALSIAGTKRIMAEVQDPFGDKAEVSIAILPDGSALIESAQAIGISKQSHLDPLKASSFGVGQMVHEAIKLGVKKVYIALEGSCTSDCGLGMVQALGGVFEDSFGKQVPGNGDGLIQVRSLDLSRAHDIIKGVEIIGLTDVEAPLTGPDGTALLYSAQKGASREVQNLLEEGAKRLLDACVKDGIADSEQNGDGAAGGLGFVLRAMLKGRLMKGGQVMLNLADFDRRAREADIVITGEGALDLQTLQGKGPMAVSERCKKLGRPCVAFAGKLIDGYQPILDKGVILAIQTGDGSGCPSPVEAEKQLYNSIVENFERLEELVG